MFTPMSYSLKQLCYNFCSNKVSTNKSKLENAQKIGFFVLKFYLTKIQRKYLKSALEQQQICDIDTGQIIIANEESFAHNTMKMDSDAGPRWVHKYSCLRHGSHGFSTCKIMLCMTFCLASKEIYLGLYGQKH